MIFYLVVNLNHRSWKVQFNIVERVVAGAVLCGGGGREALMMYDVRSCGVKTVWSIHLLQIQPATARAGKRNKTKLLSAIYIFWWYFTAAIQLSIFLFTTVKGRNRTQKQNFRGRTGAKEVLFYSNFYFFNNIRYYLPGWIFTEHINKHVRGINIIIVRVTTDGASSPGVCRHRRWPSVANWQTRLVIVMNIIHKVNIMSAAPLPCRAREVAWVLVLQKVPSEGS